MIKTYNMMRYHLGDDLAEIVISFIMPKHLLWDDIINSGSGEMVAMLHPEDYSVAYMHLAGDNEIELAKVVLRLDGGKTITSEDVKLHAQQGLENELYNAVRANDIVRTKAAILAGARKFSYACDYLGFDDSLDNASARLVKWCRGEYCDDDDENLVIKACEMDW